MTSSGSSFQCHALSSSLLSGHDSRDSTSSEQPVPQFSDAANGANASLAGKRIAVISEVLGEGVSDAVHKVLDDAIDHFKSLGASVEMVGTALCLDKLGRNCFISLVLQPCPSQSCLLSAWHQTALQCHTGRGFC